MTTFKVLKERPGPDKLIACCNECHHSGPAADFIKGKEFDGSVEDTCPKCGNDNITDYIYPKEDQPCP